MSDLRPRRLAARAGPNGSSVTRYFAFWCERCPTRLSLDTEVPSDAPGDEPQYDACDADDALVGLCHEEHPATSCPACGGRLHDVDDLVYQELLPIKGWDVAREPELHATVRRLLSHPELPPSFPREPR